MSYIKIIRYFLFLLFLIVEWMFKRIKNVLDLGVGMLSVIPLQVPSISEYVNVYECVHVTKISSIRQGERLILTQFA